MINKTKQKLKLVLAFLLHVKNELKHAYHINKFFYKLNSFYLKNSISKSNKKILIEAFFDNPGYWFSICLMLMTLSIKKENCIAITSKKNENISNIIRRLKKLGIKKILYLEDYIPPEHKFLEINTISSETDILDLKFKYNFSTNIIYDELCKLQRSSFVNTRDINLKNNLKKFEEIVVSADMLIKSHKINTIITSHNFGIYYGALTNAAIRNKIKVYTLTIEQNTLKFLKYTEEKFQHKYGSAPNKINFKKLNDRKKIIIQKLGHQYLFNRMNGNIKEVGAFFAYNKRKRIKINREYLAKKFDWHNDFPIIIIFASNYIDSPRSHGLKTFLNFREFIFETIKTLLKNKKIYVLLKPHPVDEYYVKVKNSDPSFYTSSFKSHNFNLADIEWDNISLIKLSNGIITSHGTIGIEATHLKKPVLCANIGWYGHIGFTISTDNKKTFYKFIENKFWEINSKTIKSNKTLSEQFAGWYYCNPCHNKNYKVPDNFYGLQNFKVYANWIEENKIDILKEITYLKKWVKSKTFSYHSWKTEKNKWVQK